MIILKLIGAFIAFIVITFYLVIVIGAGVTAGLRSYFRKYMGE